MRRAIQSATRLPVNASTSNHGDGPFECDDCSTEVSLVLAHRRYIGDSDRERGIEAFFRLPAHRPPVLHAPTCSYTAAGQIRVLVAQSEAVEVHLRPFEAQDGKQVFRLVMLDEAERRVERVEDKEEYRRRMDGVRAGRGLEQYFRSAAGLAKLWIALGRGGGRRELHELVSIRMRDRVVAWSKFFFEADDMPRLASLIKEQPLPHIGALLVHVRNVSNISRDRKVARCTCVMVEEGPPRILTGASVFGSADAMGGFQAERHYVVVGRWSRQEDTTRKSKWKGAPDITFQNISANVYQAAQYAEVDPPS